MTDPHSHRPGISAPRDTLARGAAPAAPGTLHLRSMSGHLSVAPRPGTVVAFGRGEPPQADLPVGEDDMRVSRRHGELTYRRSRWWLRNTGQQLVRLPEGRLMHATTDPVPLAPGYTPVFIRGSGHREHLVELFVNGHDEPSQAQRRKTATLRPRTWPLDDNERLLLVALGQHYLLYEAGPRPLTYRQAAELVECLRPGEQWTPRRVEARVEAVRRRLHQRGFPYPLLHDKDSGSVPSDNILLHNLLRGLVESTTLVPPDLALLDEPPEASDFVDRT
ncbi:flagellar motor protein MotB [Streptomyces sp. CB02923]|uniref:FHA domain-containing protein n=1 Tax=Streptomyces sp. CB02923 TaxID=1718985 RepID=UPI00093FF154|nr:FHA domain-containing protein [Streptomyces sp. CB02923]OKH99023.1 flagellar motor protein MotB [Streptomyces sp. CB02923]